MTPTTPPPEPEAARVSGAGLVEDWMLEDEWDLRTLDEPTFVRLIASITNALTTARAEAVDQYVAEQNRVAIVLLPQQLADRAAELDRARAEGIAEGATAERERCAKAVCSACANGHPRVDGGHEVTCQCDGHVTRLPCYAAAILAERGEG